MEAFPRKKFWIRSFKYLSIPFFDQSKDNIEATYLIKVLMEKALFY
jgi:hypothetical protein